jgi:hypothetical protein
MDAVKTKLTSFLFITFWLLTACQPVEISPPYPQSTKIREIVFDWSSHISLARGSDNWPITWADDDHQYTSWGDGGGFGGSNSKGRVSLGVARIEGDIASYQTFNVWGGKQPEHQSQFAGKSYGIISIAGVLYKWVSPGSGIEAYQESKLYYSSDHGATWVAVDWAFAGSDDLVNPTFAQFGRDYQGAKDNYVYVYANIIKDATTLEVQKPGETILLRVPKEALRDRAAYQYYAGIDNNQQPRWLLDSHDRRPVFVDNNGVGWNLSVSYNAGLGRYLLMTEHSASLQSNIGIFDAPEPWGPWTTVYYGKFGNNGKIQETTFFYNFSNKWLSEDGHQFVLLFTGIKSNDSWNTVSGKFVTEP